jgi:phosphoribosylformimino-5-aminoimidazole carboxamide ribonucleotide (ProFAR) isomerase
MDPRGDGMKVKVSLTLDIDPQAWADTYGIDASAVREDVKNYAENIVLTQFGQDGLLKGAES